MTKAHKAAISQAEDAVSEAEQRLAEEKSKAKLMVQAATSGRFLTAPDGAEQTQEGRSSSHAASCVCQNLHHQIEGLRQGC